MRQTGRTKNQVIEAMQQVDKGEVVVFVVDRATHTRYIIELAHKFYIGDNANSYSCNVRSGFLINLKTDGRLHIVALSSNPFLVLPGMKIDRLEFDHACYEHSGLPREWHMWVAQFEARQRPQQTVTSKKKSHIMRWLRKLNIFDRG